MEPNQFRLNSTRFIRAIWCVDSETSEECLVDLDTKEIIAKRVQGKIIDPGKEPL